MADWFSELFGFAETSYDECKRKIKVAPGVQPGESTMLESLANGKHYNAGVFETPSLAELRRRGSATKLPGHLGVTNELGDVASKHAESGNLHATFQVASQFNCLEFVGPSVVPEDGVTRYINDRTQGPACSIACGPATVYRNYFAPVGGGDDVASGGGGQTRDRQIENLKDLSRLLSGDGKELINVQGGYTLAGEAQLRKIDAALRRLERDGRLDNARAALRVGVHSDIQVTATDWGRSKVDNSQQVVTQVFGSACSVAYNRKSEPASWRKLASLVLEASYEATLWAALQNAERHGGKGGSRRVFLTCLGGGVFGNSMDWIVQAMRRALATFRDCDLDVRIITYAGRIDPRLLALEREFNAAPAKAELAAKRIASQLEQSALSPATAVAEPSKEAVETLIPAVSGLDSGSDNMPDNAAEAEPSLEDQVTPGETSSTNVPSKVAAFMSSSVGSSAEKAATVPSVALEPQTDPKMDGQAVASPTMKTSPDKKTKVAADKNSEGAAVVRPAVGDDQVAPGETSSTDVPSKVAASESSSVGSGAEKAAAVPSVALEPQTDPKMDGQAVASTTMKISPNKKRKGAADKNSKGAAVVGQAVGDVLTPQKTVAPETPAKRARAQKSPKELAGPAIEDSVLEAARGQGYEGSLRNLASRPEVVAHGASARTLLDALVASGGLVNVAKRTVLGV